LPQTREAYTKPQSEAYDMCASGVTNDRRNAVSGPYQEPYNRFSTIAKPRPTAAAWYTPSTGSRIVRNRLTRRRNTRNFESSSIGPTTQRL